MIQRQEKSRESFDPMRSRNEDELAASFPRLHYRLHHAIPSSTSTMFVRRAVPALARRASFRPALAVRSFASSVSRCTSILFGIMRDGKEEEQFWLPHISARSHDCFVDKDGVVLVRENLS